MFVNQIYRRANDEPERLAVIDSGRKIGYGEFARTIDATRSYLAQSSLPPDSVIVTIATSLYDNWVLLLALRSLGHTTVSGSSWKTIESLNLRTVTALVGFSGDPKAAEAFAAARHHCAIVEVPAGLDAPAERPLPPIEGAAFGDHIAYTSGTTGSYKKLLFKGELAASAIEQDSYGLTGRWLTEDDVFFAYSFGPWTAIGYKQVLRCWYRGAAIVFDQRPDWFDHFFDHPITMTTMVPGLLDQVGKIARARPAGYPALRIQVGGGFVDFQKATELARRLDCEVHAAYGGTEIRSVLTQLVESEEDVIWLTPNFDPGIEIVDEDDNALPAGVEGIIRIASSPNEPTEYMDDPEASAKYFKHGYFYPGDMAMRRADGRIRILGRVADVLNIGGNKVPIGPFEKALRDRLELPSLCAFMQQDDDGNEILIVAIEGERLPDRARLQAVVNGLGQFARVRFLTIDRFPRGDNGMMKINRREVLRLARETLTDRNPTAQNGTADLPQMAAMPER